MVQVVTARSVIRGRVASGTLLVGRAGIAALIVASVAAQLSVSLAYWEAMGYPDGPRNVVNYLSFFTVQSNLLAVVVLALLVVAQLGGPRLARRLGRRFDVLLLGTTSYMLVTGIVYNAAMRDVELPQGATVDWSNEVLHLIAPLWMLIDWFLSPRRRRLQWWDLGTITIFPLLWLGATFLRAPQTVAQANETPYWYPMLDPATYDNGVFGVLATCLGVAALLLAVGAGQLGYARWRASRQRASRQRAERELAPARTVTRPRATSGMR